MYDVIKRIDPYHLTAGFAECGELHAFQEPHLSLDAPIRENYRPEMAFHHNDGSVEHPGSDASLRMPPNTFEPVFNGLQAERQAVPEVARSNAFLGLITANLIHHNWYVFNSINYVRWQNVALVDKVFAEFQELSAAVLSPFTTFHPTVKVLEEQAPMATFHSGSGATSVSLNGNIRTRAWRHPDSDGGNGSCVHLVVVNSVQEGVRPEPSIFKLQIDGLSDEEIRMGATPRWGVGCVVNFTQPPMQAFMCRNVPLQRDTGSAPGSATISDVIMPTDTTIYQIGCRLPDAVPNNYVADPGFEGGLSSHPMIGPPGVPGYNLDDHQATWSIVARDEDGIPNGRSYDDSTWLRMDTTRPHSGRRAGRIALPTGALTYISLPCQRGDEHFTHQAKGDKICHGGKVNVLNHTSYNVSIWARGSSSRGGFVQLVILVPATSTGARDVAVKSANLATGADTASDLQRGVATTSSPSSTTVVKVGEPLTLSTKWRRLTACVHGQPRAAQGYPGTLALAVAGWAPRQRAATIWLDDAAVDVTNHTEGA